jgi:DNA-binding NarL/FixJ family response regulator
MSTGRSTPLEWTNRGPISAGEPTPAAAENANFSNPTAPLTALVADRQAVVREGLRSWLRADEFEVVAEVDDAAEAVLEAERLRPEVAILGVSAAEHGVAAACVAIADRAPGTATVVLAEVVDDDEVLDAALAGVSAYLLKETVDSGLPQVLRRVAAGEQVVDAAAAAALFRARQQRVRAALTDQELNVVRLAAEGCTNREIGKRLYLSRHTVKEYLSNAMRKLEVGSRVEAAVEAGRRGLLEAPFVRRAS